jgi:hypothetical protein
MPKSKQNFSISQNQITIYPGFWCGLRRDTSGNDNQPAERSDGMYAAMTKVSGNDFDFQNPDATATPPTLGSDISCIPEYSPLNELVCPTNAPQVGCVGVLMCQLGYTDTTGRDYPRCVPKADANTNNVELKRMEGANIVQGSGTSGEWYPAGVPVCGKKACPSWEEIFSETDLYPDAALHLGAQNHGCGNSGNEIKRMDDEWDPSCKVGYDMIAPGASRLVCKPVPLYT